MPFYRVIFILFLFSPFLLAAQQNVETKTYTFKDGAEVFSDAIIDDQGYTWLTPTDPSQNFFHRFDGREFKKIENYVGARSFQMGVYGGVFSVFKQLKLKDDNGKVWLGGDSGLVRLANGTVEKWFNKRNGLPSPLVMSIRKIPGEGILVFTGSGIVLIDRDDKIHTLVPGGTYDVSSLVPRARFAYPEKKGLAFCVPDSSGGIWWSVSFPGDTAATLHYFLLKDKKAVEEKKFSFPFLIYNAEGMKDGIMAWTKAGLRFFMKNGTLHPFNDKVVGYYGRDGAGRMLFGLAADKGKVNIVADKPKVPWLACTEASSMKQLPGIYNRFILVTRCGPEIWLSEFSAETGGHYHVIRGDTVYNMHDLYPSIDLSNSAPCYMDDGTVWVFPTQRKEAQHIFVNRSFGLYHFPESPRGALLILNDCASGKKKFVAALTGMFEYATMVTLDRNGKFKDEGDFFQQGSTSDGKYAWVQSRNILEDGRQEKLMLQVSVDTVYRTAVDYRAYVPDLDGGVWLLASDTSLVHLDKGVKKNFPLHIPSRAGDIVCTCPGKVFVNAEDGIYEWENGQAKKIFSGDTLHKSVIYGAPGKMIHVYNGRLSLYSSGKWQRMDTVTFPELTKVLSVYTDNFGKLVVLEKTPSAYVSKVVVMDGDKWMRIPFSDSLFAEGLVFLDNYDDAHDIIGYCESKVVRYDAGHNMFYNIADLGNTVGFIWSGKKCGDHLWLSGYTQYAIDLDLAACKPGLPKLTFQQVTCNGEACTLSSGINAAYGEKIRITYIGIERFSQSKVVYQTRLAGYSDEWSGTRKDESAEFLSLPPGDYRFEVRTRGESGIWSEPVSISIHVAPPWYRTYTAYAGFSLLFLFLMYGGVRVNGLRLEYANRQLRHKIDAATMEIRGQKEEIEEKNKSITDSIHYAQRIQRAALTSDVFFNTHLPEHFILFKPKDIVSGDFYWGGLTADGKPAWMTGDCTGHGVPGAFMSLIGISKLSEIITEKKVAEPASVLDHLRTEIIRSLNPEGVESETKDGMDAVFCVLDREKLQLEFACANNPVWIIRNNGIMEFKPDKFPVGKHHGGEKPFTQQTLTLQKGDVIYTFTDGYADQFGGEKGKKFKYRQLQEKLLELHTLPMHRQKELLWETMEKWKGGLEQVDDILIIGIRVGVNPERSA